MADKPLQNLVRMLNTDLDGNKNVLYAIRKIKGVNLMLANAVLHLLNLEKTTKLKELSKEQQKKIEEAILEPSKLGVPEWMLNRRKDPETGETTHLTTTQLFLKTQDDLKHMKKIKTYKGIRHMFGLPVRGQKTRSNFRRNKGKGKSGAIGVSAKKGKGKTGK